MTYLYEYKILDDTIRVEYALSSVTESIKVIDMWVDDKPHSVNWMGPEARAKLMDRLDKDLENRICGTYDHSIDVIDPDEPEIPGPDPETYGYNDPVSEQDEFAEGGDYNGCETEVDLDRDIPGITVTDGSEPTETEWLEQKAELALGI